MLSVFPTLLSWSQLSPFLIRLVLGAVLIYWAYAGIRNKTASAQSKGLSIVEAFAGALIVIGLWTQVAALVALIDLLVRLISRITKKSFLTDGVNYYLILLVLTISLMTTGAGWWAFDLAL